jgi:hypothetical protein
LSLILPSRFLLPLLPVCVMVVSPGPDQGGQDFALKLHL